MEGRRVMEREGQKDGTDADVVFPRRNEKIIMEMRTWSRPLT